MNKFDEMLKIGDIHIKKIELAISKLVSIFPLDERKAENFSEQEMMSIELLISRFAKLQDYIGRVLIDEVLQKIGDYDASLTMIDKINKLEGLSVIESAEMWKEMREVRNHISHEYPDKPELMVIYLNKIFDMAPELIDIFNKIKLYI